MKIEVAKLNKMLAAERAAVAAHAALSPVERRAYAAANPRSALVARAEVAADTPKPKLLGRVGPEQDFASDDPHARRYYKRHGIEHKVHPVNGGSNMDESSWGWHAGNAHALHKSLMRGYGGEGGYDTEGMHQIKGFKKLDAHVRANPKPAAKKVSVKVPVGGDNPHAKTNDAKMPSLIGTKREAGVNRLNRGGRR